MKLLLRCLICSIQHFPSAPVGLVGAHGARVRHLLEEVQVLMQVLVEAVGAVLLVDQVARKIAVPTSLHVVGAVKLADQVARRTAVPASLHVVGSEKLADQVARTIALPTSL